MAVKELRDSAGYLRRYLVPDDTPEEEVAEIGVDIGVPDLSLIDWEKVKMLLNNTLHGMKLYTYQDIIDRQSGIRDAVSSVLKKEIIHLYKEQ